MRILILFAHPAFQKSNVNKRLIEGLENTENITFHDLYEQYPELDIDVKYEQKLLEEHDCIIFHFPLFWYSTPAILKEWQDLVLEHGWAFGSKGDALKDKLFFTAITTGGPMMAYHKLGRNNHTVLELLAPLVQTARLCKMIFLPPFVVHGTHDIPADEIEKYRADYHQVLKIIADNKFVLDKALALENIDHYLTLEEQ